MNEGFLNAVGQVLEREIARHDIPKFRKDSFVFGHKELVKIYMEKHFPEPTEDAFALIAETITLEAPYWAAEDVKWWRERTPEQMFECIATHLEFQCEKA